MKWISVTVLCTVNMLKTVQIWSPVGYFSFAGSSWKFSSIAANTTEIGNLRLICYIITVQKSEVIALSYVFCWKDLVRIQINWDVLW